MFRYETAESNNAPTSVISRIYPAPEGASIRITGISFAGRSDANIAVGDAFRGIYGTLTLNADGSLSYALDNLDRDTQRLTSSSTGIERFTITFVRDNLVMTGQVEISIRGADETGQAAVDGPAIARVGSGHGADALFVSSGNNWVVQNDPSLTTGSTVVLDGTYVSRAPTEQALGFAFGAVGTAIIDGRFEVTGRTATGVGVPSDSTLINNGVISIRSTGGPGPGVGTSEAVGFGNGSSFINNGLVETISTGIGYGVWTVAQNISILNNGLIYVRGGTVDSPFGAIGIRSDLPYGGIIRNTGTIAVESDNPAKDTIAIQLYAGNTNIHSFTRVVNEGVLVAEYAIRSLGSLTLSVHAANSGRIEGDLDLGAGNHIIDNRAGGVWRGAVTTGPTQDVVRNAGQIIGHVHTQTGQDFYDGRGGHVTGTITVGSGISYGGNRDDRLIGGDVIIGGGGQDVLTGTSGGNRFVFQAASDSSEQAPDTIVGFVSGQDRIDLSALSITSLTLEASGNHTNIRVQTNDGPMWIIVGNSSVAMTDILLERAGQRIDGGSTGDVIWGAVRDAVLNGAGGDDMIVGTDGQDRIDGGTGADVLWGGLGNDVYFIDNDGDRVIELEGEGLDEVRTLAGYSLQAYVENLTLIGTGNIGGSGNIFDNVLTGNSGHNELFGREGNDILIGGGGADYLVGNAGRDRFVYLDVSDSTFSTRDQIDLFEYGIDTIDISALDAVRFTFDLFHNYWTVTFTTVYIETAKGDTLVLRVSGNTGFSDFAVRNSQTGSDGADSMTTGTTRGSLSGAAGDDQLTGSDGADFLDGGRGNDWLAGGAGNDQYFVDALGDLVFEGAGAGIDVVISNASHYLHANVEHLELGQGASDWFGVGNALDNDIIGNSGANLLLGGAGHDFIFGGESDDILYGEDGDDIMLGGGGTDYLFGGAGDDVLGDGEQGLERFGRADALYGEAGNDHLDGGIGFYTDILVGGDGDDLLDADSGEGGDYDLIDGGAGNDVYLVDTGDDLTFEAVDGGIDTVRANVLLLGAGVYLYANVENLILEGITAFGVGNGLANSLTGNVEGNYLLGGGGDDRIDGRGGNDVLFGEVGADRFIFGVGGGGDVIGDFTRGGDLIDISAFGFTSFAQVQSRFVQDGNIGAILLGNGDLIVLHNVQMAQLTAADFVI